MERETAMKILKELHDNSLFSNRIALETLIPELAGSNDERIRKALLEMVHDTTGDELWVDYNVHKEEALAWLEKQGYTKKDIDNAYLKGISDAKDELEKQGTPAKLSEEEQNSFAKGVLSNCALSFINYLDAHSYEGKMCVSNGECEDIEDAFHNAMWDRLHRYYCKYIEKQGEQKPVLDFKASNWYVSKVDGKLHNIYQSVDKIEQKPTSDTRYEVKAGDSLSVNSKPFDYEHATITQKDFTPKGEPKFNVGDYIVSDYCIGRVVEITNDAYLLDAGQGISFLCEDNMHLWTIADAKEGDILAGKIDGDNYILIFKTIKDGWIETYGYYYNAVDRFCVPSQLFCRSYQGTFTLATKEQRNTLMKAMTDAGYTFDFEKKELKKIEDEIEIPFGAKDSELQEVTYYIPKGFHAEIDDDKVVIKKGEKSTAWNDEDENYLQSAENACEYQYGKNTSTILWLKSLKDRIGG